MWKNQTVVAGWNLDWHNHFAKPRKTEEVKLHHTDSTPRPEISRVQHGTRRDGILRIELQETRNEGRILFM